MTLSEQNLALASSLKVRVIDNVCVDLLDEMRADIERYQTMQPRKTATLNKGGWKSGEIFWESYGQPDEWSSRATQVLRDTIEQAHITRGRIYAGWAMINKDGSCHPPHQHSTARITGVYYVTPGDPPAPTIFRGAKPFGRDLSIFPHPGRLVLFPGDLWHWVPEVKSAAPRITIAFDVRY